MTQVVDYIVNVWQYMGSSSEEVKAVFRKNPPNDFELYLLARAITRVYEQEDRKAKKKDRYEQTMKHLNRLMLEA